MPYVASNTVATPYDHQVGELPTVDSVILRDVPMIKEHSRPLRVTGSITGKGGVKSRWDGEEGERERYLLCRCKLHSMCSALRLCNTL